MATALVTVATRAAPPLAAWHASALAAGWGASDVYVLGREFAARPFSFGMKLAAVAAWVATQPPSRLLLFTDGFDVALLGGPADARAAYTAVVSDASRDILMAAEPNCWPDAHLAAAYPRARGARFLNSGVYMGRADAVAAMLAAAPFRLEDDDQRHLTALYLRQQGGGVGAFRIVLDHESRLARCMTNAPLSTLPRAALPVVLHLNGDKRDLPAAFALAAEVAAARHAYVPLCAALLLLAACGLRHRGE